MRNLRYSRSSTLVEPQRRLSLNTVVLPPLPATIVETGAEILEKFLVAKAKPGSVNTDLVAVARAQDATARPVESAKPSDAGRVAQLEQNIRFLQDQHQLMLNGLHHEIDSLRHRNRELQFQVVFAKTSLPSTPSSPEDESKPKMTVSPKQVNVTPLQVEILERELGDLKIQMQEVDSRNVYLSAIVDEQKKKLERYERDRERERERGIQPDPELLRKLDDAEALIRRLRRENSDLRREGSSSPSGGYREPPAYRPRDHGSPHQAQKGPNQNRGNGRHRGQYRNWFPPVHTQNYWQNGRAMEKNGGAMTGADGNSLPTLSGASGMGNGGHHQGRRGNNNHYHNEGRKYRGGGGQNRGNKPT